MTQEQLKYLEHLYQDNLEQYEINLKKEITAEQKGDVERARRLKTFRLMRFAKQTVMEDIFEILNLDLELDLETDIQCKLIER